MGIRQRRAGTSSELPRQQDRPQRDLHAGCRLLAGTRSRPTDARWKTCGADNDDGLPGQNWSISTGNRIGKVGFVASATHSYKEQYAEENRKFLRVGRLWSGRPTGRGERLRHADGRPASAARHRRQRRLSVHPESPAWHREFLHPQRTRRGPLLPGRQHRGWVQLQELPAFSSSKKACSRTQSPASTSSRDWPTAASTGV